MPEGPAGRQPVAETQSVGATQCGAGVADADTRIDSLKDDIRALGYSVRDLQEKATAHDAKFAEILLTLRAHGSKLESHDRRFDQIDARFEQVDARFEQVDARFDQIDARFDQIDRRFFQIDRRFLQIDARFEQIDGRFEQTDAKLAEILARLPQRPR